MKSAVGNVILEPPARALVFSARLLSRHRVLTSCLGLLLVLVLGIGYLLLGSLQVNPLQSQYRVRVELAQSGGLLPDQDVTLRGVRVGRVRSVEVDGDKVVAVAAIDSGVRIPRNGDVRVSSLSAVGEQFLDFLPAGGGGPYLANGAVVTPDRTSTPVTMAQALGSMSGTLTQIDPAQIEAIVREIGAGSDGPQRLAALVDGGMFLLSTLDSVLPQTVSLLHNSKAVLTTLGDVAPGLRETAGNLARTAAGVGSMTGGYGALVDNAPDALAAADAIIADNSPTMVQLLGNLTTTAQMAYLHIPALREFFWPQQRTGSTLDAIHSAFHDGAVWAIVSPYPRYACDYDLPRDPGSVPDYPEPFLHARCTNPDPSILPRGAANAPRPPGDNTATAPPGADPLQRADPTPPGAYTIPPGYGGPFVPGG
ncbi:MlaD family protein [Nocardia mexicana]|uniref:Virulence factor Mce-like protein n=1 Tax=Nocardia mexicana TaxID=279262 RepID=A0A370GNU5_9NOCA|nr:MCE family protein [Nocardia mexicana]RDI45040.1 virulence factor Mce-like protein [Nocardia mexicana]